MASPAKKFRIAILQATIWRNFSDGRTWYSVNLTRGFKTDEGWRNTDSLGQNDLQPARALLEMADKWIAERLEEESKIRKEAQEAA